jgi:hypothetical protein
VTNGLLNSQGGDFLAQVKIPDLDIKDMTV